MPPMPHKLKPSLVDERRAANLSIRVKLFERDFAFADDAARAARLCAALQPLALQPRRPSPRRAAGEKDEDVGEVEKDALCAVTAIGAVAVVATALVGEEVRNDVSHTDLVS